STIPLTLLHRIASHPSLPCLPTRRSSDLDVNPAAAPVEAPKEIRPETGLERGVQNAVGGGGGGGGGGGAASRPPTMQTKDVRPRSEEHTSELQSLTNFACRLLLGTKTCRR